MTAQVSHIDEKTRGIVSTLAQRVDELAHDVASAVRAEVDFYKSTGAVADDDLLAGCTEPRRGRQALFSLTMSLILRRFVARPKVGPARRALRAVPRRRSRHVLQQNSLTEPSSFPADNLD